MLKFEYDFIVSLYQADIVFDDEASLYSAIQQMAKVAKCPLVLTSEVPLNFLRVRRNIIPTELVTGLISFLCLCDI